MNSLCFMTPLGEMTVYDNGTALTELRFGRFEEGETTPLLQECRKQLEEYFAGNRTSFSLPVFLEGTVFQKRVWQALTRIPYGEVWSYKRLAEEIGNPKACRAVGMANHKNPLSIIIPCHRVIGADGALIGYGGGLDKKKFLLELEKTVIHNG